MIWTRRSMKWKSSTSLTILKQRFWIQLSELINVAVPVTHHHSRSSVPDLFLPSTTLPATCKSSLTTPINLLFGLFLFLSHDSSLFNMLIPAYRVSFLFTFPNQLNLASLTPSRICQSHLSCCSDILALNPAYHFQSQCKSLQSLTQLSPSLIHIGELC